MVLPPDRWYHQSPRTRAMRASELHLIFDSILVGLLNSAVIMTKYSWKTFWKEIFLTVTSGSYEKCRTLLLILHMFGPLSPSVPSDSKVMNLLLQMCQIFVQRCLVRGFNVWPTLGSLFIRILNNLGVTVPFESLLQRKLVKLARVI